MEHIPPIIVAADHPNESDAIEFVESVSSFDTATVGIKIPIHHINKSDFMIFLQDEERYVVLDTRLHDDIDHMADSVASLLADRPDFLLPNAITVHPPMSASSINRDSYKKRILDVARERGVQVIGYSTTVEHETGIDDQAVIHETKAMIGSREFGLDGHEIHAANLAHGKFLEELTCGSRGYMGNTNLELRYRDLRSESWPHIIASKFQLPLIKARRRLGNDIPWTVTGNTPNTPEARAKLKITLSDDELSEMALQAAGISFGFGVGSVYLGRSLRRIPAEARPDYIERVLKIRDAVGGLAAADCQLMLFDVLKVDVSKL